MEPVRRRRRRPSRLRRALRVALRLLALAAVFAGGVALGQALDDDARPGGTVTRERSLRPLPLPPVRQTVTVTARTEGVR